MKEELIKMDENGISEVVTENQEPQAKTYTEEEVKALLQQEGDRRVTDALKKAERKNEAKVKEAEKLAKMNEEQRYNYELEQREKAIAEKEAQLALAENKAEASKVLASKGISPELVSLVVAADADTMLENINLLEEAFKTSVKNEVEKRLATSTPKKNLPLDNAMTKEGFKKLSLSQQAELYKNNPNLYHSLSGR